MTSVNSILELNNFIKEAIYVMNAAKFGLRGCEFTDPTLQSVSETMVLGMKWDNIPDTLSVNEQFLKDVPLSI